MSKISIYNFESYILNFIGNSQAVTYFHTIIDRIIANNKIEHGFLLLCGPQYIGKTTLIETVVDQLITSYKLSDYCFIQDFSDQWLKFKEDNDKLIWTQHSIKISNDNDKADIKLPDGSYYKDLGVREIIEWLGKSPTWSRKLLVIENIERMGIGAANALLKTLEEPLENRLIICTCSDPHQLMPTIVSRGILINFYPVPTQQLLEWLKLEYDWELAMWRPGLAIRMLQDPKYQELLVAIKKVDATFLQTELISNKLALFTELNKQWLLRLFLDMLQVKFAQDRKRSAKLIQAKKYLDSNVGVGNVLMDMFISSSQ